MSYEREKLLTDIDGKPIPQYYDIKSGKFKPITTGNFPDVQRVEVNNIPTSQRVRVVNHKDIQGVEGNVNIDNLPSDYPDVNVKHELEQIKEQQQQILDRFNSPIDTQVTGSIGAKIVGEEMVVHEDEITIAPNSSIVLASAELAGLAGKTKIRVYLLRPSQNYELTLMSRIRVGTGWESETIDDNGSSSSLTRSSTYDLEFPITTHVTPQLRITNKNEDEEMTVSTTVIVAI